MIDEVRQGRMNVIRFLQGALQDATDILEDLVTEVDAEMMAERPNLRLLVPGEPPEFPAC